MIRRMALSCLLPAGLIAAEPAELPPLSTEASAKALVEDCLKRMVAGDYKGGFDLLKPYWAVPSNEVDTLIIQTMSTRSLVKDRFGKSLGYEFIAQKRAGKSFLQIVAIEKLERTAIRYSVIFYMAKDSWVLQNFTWDDKVGLLFE